jgi:hypothetical protein
VPQWASEATLSVVTSTGRATSRGAFLARNHPRIPDDVGWKAGYVNSVPPPWPFHFVLLWGIAIADILHVGQRPDRVWHFWPPSARHNSPPGKLEGGTAKARVRISPGALLQLGMHYWRDATVPWGGSDGINHEAGASNCYLPSQVWQEAVFTDIGAPFE